MELEIEVFYHSDETVLKLEMGTKYSLLECDTRFVTFYNISTIAPHEDEVSGQWFCKIFFPGDALIATKTYEEVKKIIHEHLKNKNHDDN